MAQVKVTEYFNSCKRRFDVQPHKRRKITDGFAQPNYGSVPNGKCFGSDKLNEKIVEIDIKSNRKFLSQQIAPNKTVNNSKLVPHLSASNLNKKKSQTLNGLKKKVDSNSSLVDIRQAFAGIKPSGDVSTRKESSLDDAKARYLTPKKTHSSTLSSECSPPKRRKQLEDADLSRKNDSMANSDNHTKVSARRSLVMTIDRFNGLVTTNKKVTKTTEAPGMPIATTENHTADLNRPTTVQNAKETKTLTPAQVKERLEKCGNLGEVKKLLTSLKKQTEKLKNKAQYSPQKIRISPKLAKSPKKLYSVIAADRESRPTPAYERFHSLATEGTPSLTLPYKYKLLADIFRSVDTVVSLLHNRQEMCTFTKLKYSVQSMMKKAFEKYSLCQIKTVFPLAYFFHQEKCHPNYSARKHKVEPYELTITPNFNYATGIEGETSVSAPSSTSEKKALLMNPSCLLERRNIFQKNLLSIVKKHHQAFLETLNVPVAISSDDIQRWHPRFDLNQVPEIEPSSLPEPPGTTYSTAQDVLDRVQNTLGEKIESALKSVAEKKATLTQTDAESSVQASAVSTGALKGISQSLIEKIRAKEAKRLAKEMTRKPEDDKKLEMISRLPELVRILRTYFITERKAAISVEHAKMKLSESYHSHLSPEEVEQHISLLSNLLPDWLSLITIRKGVFLKIDKNMEVALLLEMLETERKRMM